MLGARAIWLRSRQRSKRCARNSHNEWVVEFSIAIGALAAQMQSAPPYRGPPVVYVPPGYNMPAPPVRQIRPAPQQCALSQSEERERIIDAGEAFCRKYPTDRVCHPKDSGP
jgi:hypothetical protein